MQLRGPAGIGRTGWTLNELILLDQVPPEGVQVLIGVSVEALFEMYMTIAQRAKRIC